MTSAHRDDSKQCIVVADGVSSYARAYLAPELGESSTKLRSTESNTDTTDEGKMYSVHRGAMASDKLRANPLTSCASHLRFSPARPADLPAPSDFFDGCMRTFLGPDSHLKIAPLDNNQQVSFVRSVPSLETLSLTNETWCADLRLTLALQGVAELARPTTRR